MENDRPVGFISGIDDESRLNTKGLYVRSVAGMLRKFYSPAMMLSVLRHTKRIVQFRKVEIKSELLSVVVDRGCRGKGIGMKLVNTLENYFRAQNIPVYKVYTDMNYSTGYRLYERTGFTLFKEVNLFSLPFRMYFKELEHIIV